MKAPWLQRSLIVAAMLALAWQAVFAAGVFGSDLLSFDVDRQVIYWGVDGRKPTREEADAALGLIERALALWPQHPDYLAMKARILVWRGQIAELRTNANEQYRLAADTMRQSIDARPANPYSWAQYAEILAGQRGHTAELRLAINKVHRLAPGNTKLQQRMQSLKVP